MCQCGAFYIGKPIREFWRRTYDHTHLAEIGNIYSPIGQHMVQVHNYHVPKLTFWALEHAEQNSRGGNWNKFILQRESR